jgi:hypothetical protein
VRSEPEAGPSSRLMITCHDIGFLEAGPVSTVTGTHPRRLCRASHEVLSMALLYFSVRSWRAAEAAPSVTKSGHSRAERCSATAGRHQRVMPWKLFGINARGFRNPSLSSSGRFQVIGRLCGDIFFYTPRRSCCSREFEDILNSLEWPAANAAWRWRRQAGRAGDNRMLIAAHRRHRR